MPNTIRLRRGTGAPSAASFQVGEPAWDQANGALYIKNAAGTMVQVGGGSGGAYTVSATAPTSPAAGDRWLDTNSGIEYSYVNDGTSSQWVETGAPGDPVGGSTGTGDVVAAGANAFTGANTFTNATGQTFRRAATQDGILLRGRAGGTTSLNVELVPATLTASRTLTAPDVDGTIVTTGDTGTVTGAMIAPGTITDTDISASAAIVDTKLATISTAGKVSGGAITSGTIGGTTAINTSGNITTSGTITGDLTPAAGTSSAGGAPLKFTSGTNLTTPEAGAVEYDGTHVYATPTTTSGRGQIPVLQTFRLAAVGSAIGGTIADFYGATSAINLAASTGYDLEFWPYFQKNTAGTVTWTLTASSAPNVISGIYWGSPVGGIAAGTPITGYAGSRAATTAAFAATASVLNNAFMAFSIKVQVFTNAATTFKLQVTCGAGTVTPQAGSFYTVRQISATTGSFA